MTRFWYNLKNLHPSVSMASSNGGLFGDPMPWLEQKVNPFHTNFLQGTCMKFVEGSKTKDIQLA